MAVVDEQANTSTTESELCDEILNALPDDSELTEAAFAQLRGSAQPFKVAISIRSALPEDLRKRSQEILRSWAIRETNEQKAQRERRREKKAQQAAARLELKAKNHELAVLQRTPHRKSSKKRTKSSRSSEGAKKHRAVADECVAIVATSSTVADKSDICKHPSGCVRSGKGNTRGMCATHGGRTKCVHASGCERRSKGVKVLCMSHGGGVRPNDRLIPIEDRCKHSSGCARNGKGHARGMCFAHGGVLICKFKDGCEKHAVGPARLCIKHGGGKQCGYEGGCEKRAERKGFCSAHGGRRTCQFRCGTLLSNSVEGTFSGVCGKKAQQKGYCNAHGGGNKCTFEGGCEKPARGKGLCFTHGGGRKCKLEGCEKAVQANGLCMSHGGVRQAKV